MFEQTFVNTQGQTRKPWTVAVSVTAQAGFVSVMLLLPLLYPGAIQPDLNVQPTLYLTKLAQPPAPPQIKTAAVRRRTVRVFSGLLVAPTRVPAAIDMTPEPAPEAGIVAIAGVGDMAGLLNGRGAALPQIPPPPPPIAPKPQIAVGPVRVSSGAQAARLIFGPKPLYPQLAKAARVQGTVKMQATIGRDGSIRDLHVVSGPPLLVNAAMEAVRQWRYQPTLLSGEPVEVATEIDVNFTLN